MKVIILTSSQILFYFFIFFIFCSSQILNHMLKSDKIVNECQDNFW